jgi:hypothetical protein
VFFTNGNYAPDHSPIMPPFIRYSIICRDNQNCNFEVWITLSSMRRIDKKHVIMRKYFAFLKEPYPYS